MIYFDNFSLSCDVSRIPAIFLGDRECNCEAEVWIEWNGSFRSFCKKHADRYLEFAAKYWRLTEDKMEGLPYRLCNKNEAMMRIAIK